MSGVQALAEPPMEEVWRNSKNYSASEQKTALISQDEARQIRQEASEDAPPLAHEDAEVLEDYYDEEIEIEDKPWHWDHKDEMAGFVYWVIKVYKSRKSSDQDFFLKDCEGELKPGELCCVLSPKESSSYFMNLVSGRASKADFMGEIVVGGVQKTAPLMKVGTSFLLWPSSCELPHSRRMPSVYVLLRHEPRGTNCGGTTS